MGSIPSATVASPCGGEVGINQQFLASGNVRKTILNPPPNSHVIQFIPPAATQDGKPRAPITVYVNSSDGKPLDLTSNDLLTLTQALQAANIGKDKTPSGPVQVILQQQDVKKGKSAKDESKEVSAILGASTPGGAQKKAENKGGASGGQSGRSQGHGDPSQITLDDLTAILKADESATGIEFVSEDPNQPQQMEVDTRGRTNSQININNSNAQTSSSQFVPVQVVSQKAASKSSQEKVGQEKIGQENLGQTSTQKYPEVGNLLSRAPLNAVQVSF